MGDPWSRGLRVHPVFPPVLSFHLYRDWGSALPPHSSISPTLYGKKKLSRNSGCVFLVGNDGEATRDASCFWLGGGSSIMRGNFSFALVHMSCIHRNRYDTPVQHVCVL